MRLPKYYHRNMVAHRSDDVELSTQSLSCAVPVAGKPHRFIISNITGVFAKPGRLSFVLGQSGSGKTTFLQLLRGHAPADGYVRGSVLANGRIVQAKHSRRFAQYVPQEDVFISSFTAREFLRFTAELRYHGGASSSSQKGTRQGGIRQESHQGGTRAYDKVVDDVLRGLGLVDCADTVIGDPSADIPGLSGGERRRLSIAVALLTSPPPSCLLLDECTSGLDSKAAYDMVLLLKSLAQQKGLAILVSVHQPSWRICELADELTILHRGEKVFQGDWKAAESHFTTNSGAGLPKHINPAEHYLDLLQTSLPSAKATWRQVWKETGADSNVLHVVDVNGNFMKHFTDSSAETLDERFGSGYNTSFWQQYDILARRGLKDVFKDKRKLLRGLRMRVFPSLLLGLFFLGLASSQDPGSFSVLGVQFIAIQSTIFDACFTAALQFPADRRLLSKEYFDGSYSLSAWYLAYWSVLFVLTLLWSFAYATPIYFMAGFARTFFAFGTFASVLMACCVFGLGFGIYLGIYAKDYQAAKSMALPLLIPLMLFSGYILPFASIPWFWRWLYYVSPYQYALTILRTAHHQHSFAANRFAPLSANSSDDASVSISVCFAILLAEGFGFMAVSYFLLRKRIYKQAI